MLFAAAAGAVLKFAEAELMAVEGWAIALISIFAALCVLNLLIIGLQPSSGTKLFFRVGRRKKSAIAFLITIQSFSADSNFLFCDGRFLRAQKKRRRIVIRLRPIAQIH